MKNLNKKDLINAIVEVSELSKKDTEIFLGAFQEVVKRELKEGNKIQMIGFGTFEVAERAAREGRNPKTGETMMFEASKSPKFKAGKSFKDYINA